ncbi:hypothetical protein H0R92_10825 [Treponema sp. OMZ 840]|uniref:hypothetical protein n=1 Tax=Treponema sp. OMZ 840 TaxID=244313 RepID=UPI003D8F8B74
MKKLAVVFFVFSFTVLLYAGNKVTFSAGAAYTHYFLQNKLDPSAAHTSPSWSGMKTGIVREKITGPALSVDIRAHYFYTMMQICFAKNDFSDILNTGNLSAALVNSGAYVLDIQSGAGYTFFRNKPVTVFLGGALGFNARNLAIKISGNEYTRTDIIFGTGVNALLSCYPLSFLGLYMGVADTVYFLPLKTVRKFDDGQLKASVIKSLVANSFNVKAGIAIRL